MRHILALAFLLLSFTFCHAKILNVRSFGAVGDGKSIDSDAINSAIADASRHEGDTVYLPEGRYSCYSIHLKSNVTLMLHKNATILLQHLSATRAMISMTLMNPDERPEVYKKDVSNMSIQE